MKEKKLCVCVCVCVCVCALVHVCLCMPCLITPLLFSRQHQLCQVASSWRNLMILVWKSKNWNPMIGSFAWICSTQIPPALLNPRMHLPPAALLLWVLELVVHVSAWCSSVKVLFWVKFPFCFNFYIYIFLSSLEDLGKLLDNRNKWPKALCWQRKRRKQGSCG